MFILDILIDIVFMIDIALMFFTTYRNKKGEEITDHVLIRKNYIYSVNFVVDFLSILGNRLFRMINRNIGLLSEFKIFRIDRLRKYIEESDLLQDTKLVLNFLKYSLYYLLIFHLIACYWNWIAMDTQRIEFYKKPEWVPIDRTDGSKLEEWYRFEWIPPVNAIFFPDVALMKTEWTQLKKYFFNLYNAIMFLSIGDIYPVDELQSFNAFSLMLTAGFINFFLLGKFGTLVGSMQQSSSIL